MHWVTESTLGPYITTLGEHIRPVHCHIGSVTPCIGSAHWVRQSALGQYIATLGRHIRWHIASGKAHWASTLSQVVSTLAQVMYNATLGEHIGPVHCHIGSVHWDGTLGQAKHIGQLLSHWVSNKGCHIGLPHRVGTLLFHIGSPHCFF